MEHQQKHQPSHCKDDQRTKNEKIHHQLSTEAIHTIGLRRGIVRMLVGDRRKRAAGHAAHPTRSGSEMADTHQQRAGNPRLGRRLRRGRQDRRVRGEPQQRRIAGRTED